MKAVLVINHFLTTNKYNELHRHLADTAKRMGIDLDIETNLTLALKNVKADFVLFWDKDINLARRLEQQGLRVFNSADSIEKCDDKARTYIELYEKVRQPETVIAPKTYFETDMHTFVEQAVNRLGLPIVFKECFGSFGEQVYLCSSMEEVLSRISAKPFILQKFIRESSGRDKRLEVVGGKCVCAVRRENKNDFRSNVTNGGTMTPCAASEAEKQLAVDACEILGLDFGGVDILDGRYVCEVNSNAHIINIMKSGGIDIAPLIFNHILEKIK